MNRKFRSLIIGAAAAFALAASPSLAGDLFVVHAINGGDLGFPEALPVDIGLDGGCTPLQDVEFGQSAFAATLGAGIYEAQVYLADGAACGGTLAVAADIEIPVVGTVFAVAHLDQNGVPTLSAFTARLDDIGSGLAKVQVAHAAAAPAVDVFLKGGGKRGKLRIRDLGPGEQSFAAQVDASRSYSVLIRPASGGKPVLRLSGVEFTADAYTIVFAVGTPAGGTFTVLPVEVTP
jgi:hypothetical protein